MDREDNDGHYEPGNLRWVPSVINVNNSRKTRGERRARFIAIRLEHPEITYADTTLQSMLGRFTDEEIIARFHNPSCKPKGKYGTSSTLGLYRGSLPTD